MRRVCIATLVLLLAAAAAVSAAAGLQTAFPRLDAGLGNQPTAGGGVVAGNAYVTRTSLIVWSRRWNTLTLYLLWRKGVTCQTLQTAITKPGDLIQVFVTDQPRISLLTPVADPQVAFVTVHRDPKVPQHVAGLKNGAQLRFTRIDSKPGGVWHGSFKVPRHVYGNGKLYAYNGTFAAKWCDVRQ